MRSESTLARHPGRLLGWIVFILSLTALNYAGRFSGAADEVDGDLAYRYSTSVAAVIQFAIMLGIALLIARGLDTRAAFGLHRPESWPRAAGLVAAALAAIYAFSFAYVQALSLVTDEDPSCEQGIAPTEWDPDRALAFAVFFAAVVVVAPVVEELIYRGLGFALLAPFGTMLAVLGTGALFGLSHGLVLGLPVLATFGIVVGWLRARTRSSYPGMLLHGIFNGIALIAAVAGGSPC